VGTAFTSDIFGLETTFLAFWIFGKTNISHGNGKSTSKKLQGEGGHLIFIYQVQLKFMKKKKKALKIRGNIIVFPAVCFDFSVSLSNLLKVLHAWRPDSFFLAISADLIKDITSPCKTCISWNIIPLQSTLG